MNVPSIGRQNRFEEALPPAETATRLDPLSPIMTTITASLLGASGHIEEARRMLDEVLDATPGFWVALLHRAELALTCDDKVAALADLQGARDKSHGRMQVVGPLGYTLAWLGHHDEARALLASLEARTDEQYVPPSIPAMILAGLGVRDGQFPATPHRPFAIPR